jgi:hypothetical protein
MKAMGLTEAHEGCGTLSMKDAERLQNRGGVADRRQ